jgi:hypothetical protein
MEDYFFYTLNRTLSNYLKPEHSNLLKHKKAELDNLLNSDYSRRIRPDILEKLKLLVNTQKIRFEAVTEDIGKTYALFVSDPNYKGLCLILKVDLNSNISDKPKLYGSASSFEAQFINCFRYISKIIQNNLKDAYFYPDIFKKLEMKFLTPLNEPINNLKLIGNSLEFPLCIAIFSALLKEEVDISIACSGNVTEDLKITFIDGAEEKIEAAIIEYPEIKKILLPADCQNLNLEKKYPDITIQYVSTLEEGLEIFFPNFKELINQKDFSGKISFGDEIVELDNGDKAVKIFLNFDYSSDLQPDILKYIDGPINKILNKYNNSDISCFLLDNFRPTWFVPALMKLFINKKDLVAVYYTKKNYIIVYERFVSSRLGTIVRIKD